MISWRDFLFVLNIEYFPFPQGNSPCWQKHSCSHGSLYCELREDVIVFSWLVQSWFATHRKKLEEMDFVEKGSPASFSPGTSRNVRISSRNFLTFSFNPFATQVWNFKFVPSASPKLLNLNQDHPSKTVVFWSNPYKIEVVITSLIEMLQLPNFSHMNTFTM